MAIQLTESELHFIKSSLLQHLPHAKFYLFGSRATGKAKKYSDIDILIVAKEKIPLATLSILNELFSESDLLYKIDIVDWHRITSEFREKIKTEQILI